MSADTRQDARGDLADRAEASCALHVVYISHSGIRCVFCNWSPMTALDALIPGRLSVGASREVGGDGLHASIMSVGTDDDETQGPATDAV